jgi:glycosyltransferase involved in cell wall biosynthesis
MINNKKICVIQSPCTTTSGYGARSRDFIRAFVTNYSDEFNIKLVATHWGASSWDALSEEDEDLLGLLDNSIQPFKPWPFKPDLFIQITVPNEFQPRGVLNIGVTAGIESTKVHDEIVAGINRMDLTLLSSNHGLEVLMNTGAITRPMEVLFEGYDPKVFFRKAFKNFTSTELTYKMEQVKTSNNFLYVGHWLKGDLGHDRKDVGGLVQTFLESFANTELKLQPGLILKTSCGTYSHMDFTEVKNRVQYLQHHCVNNLKLRNLPPVYILHGHMTGSELNELYNHPKVTCHISFNKAEGFGRPLLEAATSAAPILATNWSGPLDFLKPSQNTLLPFDLTPVHPSAADDKYLLLGGNWATVNYTEAASLMQQVLHNTNKFKKAATSRPSYILQNFTIDQMRLKMKNILEGYLKRIPATVNLDLPDLLDLVLPDFE